MADTILDLIERDNVSSEPVLLSPQRAPAARHHLAKSVIGLASAMRAAGVRDTDVIASMVPNGPDAVTVFLAATVTGIAAPLNPSFRSAELGAYLEDLKPALAVLPPHTPDETVEAVRSAGIPILRVTPRHRAGDLDCGEPAGTSQAAQIAPSPDHVALILHTSGTTSRPKMVPLTHKNLVTSAKNVASTLRLGPSDRCLNVMPLFHIHGLVAALLATLHAGGSIVATPGYVATEFHRWMSEFAPTWFTAVPTIYQSVLDRFDTTTPADRPGSLRFIRSSSASLPPTVMEALEDAFDVPVVEAYGMTECAHQITSNQLPPNHRHPGSVGVAAGPEVRILTDGEIHRRTDEEGEVVVRGDTVMRSYRATPEVNDGAFVDGWFRTGDLGRLDSNGTLRLTGRTKEMINRGGETIAPREIDEALLMHPAVRQALAFGVPDRRLGEQPAAAVVLEDGMTTGEPELRRWVEQRLSDAKVPRRIVFLDEIPKGATGKLQRIGMADRLGLRDLDAAEPPGQTGVAPRTRTERFLAELWSEVLDRTDIGVEDRFLDAGGDSMLALRLLARVRQQLGIDPSVVEFFERATVAAQATLIDDLLMQDD